MQGFGRGDAGERAAGKGEWFVPVSHAADILGCHWRTVGEMIGAGMLDFIQIPGIPANRIAVSLTSIQDYMGRVSHP